MKKPVSHIIGTVAISLILAAPGWCSVLSAGQMLEPFLKATQKIRTVTIDMETTIHDSAYGTASIEERLVIGQGGRFRAERRFPQGETILIQDGRKTVLREIERERRIPLRFVGVAISDGGPIVLKAEYGEYRQIGEDVWLPGTIAYYRDDLPWVVSNLRHISLNDRLSETLFRVPERGEAHFPVPDFLNIKD